MGQGQGRTPALPVVRDAGSIVFRDLQRDHPRNPQLGALASCRHLLGAGFRAHGSKESRRLSRSICSRARASRLYRGLALERCRRNAGAAGAPSGALDDSASVRSALAWGYVPEGRSDEALKLINRLQAMIWKLMH